MDCLLDGGVAISDEVKEAFNATGVRDEGLNIQEVAYKFLKYLGSSPAPRIHRCEGIPPQLPNVYTDGSYLHPGSCLAHASFVSWEPARTIDALIEEESDFCRPLKHLGRKGPSGISMAGTIPGVLSSSTRAELAGVIAAMAKPGPLHIALDNLSVGNGVQDILDGTQRSRRPWALRADGDLWTIA